MSSPSANRAIRKLIRADLICLGGIGLLPVSHDSAEALYRVVDAADEQRTIGLNSNLHPPVDDLMLKPIANATVVRCMHHTTWCSTGDSIHSTKQLATTAEATS